MACGLPPCLSMKVLGASAERCPQPAQSRLTSTPMRPCRLPSSSFRRGLAWLASSSWMRVLQPSHLGSSSSRRPSNHEHLTDSDTFRLIIPKLAVGTEPVRFSRYEQSPDHVDATWMSQLCWLVHVIMSQEPHVSRHVSSFDILGCRGSIIPYWRVPKVMQSLESNSSLWLA